MDINSLIYQPTAEMIVRGHNGEPMLKADDEPMSITFFSDDTTERLRAYSNYRKNLIEAGKDNDLLMDAECQLLADLTHRFNGVIYNGDEVTLKDAPAIYKNIAKLRGDAMTFVGNAENFI